VSLLNVHKQFFSFLITFCDDFVQCYLFERERDVSFCINLLA
jgi:hypothetical protein